MIRLAIITCTLASSASASKLVIDAFLFQGFERNTTGTRQFIAELPIAWPRQIHLPRPTSDTTFYIEGAPADGFLYYGFGNDLNSGAPIVTLDYNSAVPYSLSDYSAFILEFTDVHGSGIISINLGFGKVNIPVSKAGIVTIPFSEWIVPVDSPASFSNVSLLTFKWQNTTNGAGFTLREIAAIQTAIPEPATYATLTSLAALSTLMFRRPHRQ